MLVLSRKVNQSIMIGDEVRIIVAGFDGDQVRLGIEAPRSVPVYRFEIYEELRRKEVGKESAGPDNPR